MISNYYLLPEFTPTRLQDLVLWFEPASLRGNTWYNLAPCYNRNHGTIFGGVGLSTWHPQFSPAPTFDGFDGYVKVPDSDNLVTTAITIEAWMNSNLLGEFRGIVFKGQAWMFREGAANGTVQAHVYVDDGWRGITSIGTYTPHVWSYAVMTYDSNTRELAVYVNNVSRSRTLSGLNSYTINPSGANIFIGTDTAYGDIYFNGSIPLVRIYKVALTPTEIYHNHTHHPLYYIERGIDPYDFIKRKKFYFL